MDKEFSIFVISNDCQNIHPDNALTNFINDFPEPFILSKEHNWHVCVESIGFSCNMQNVTLPPNNIPSLIIIKNFEKDFKILCDPNKEQCVNPNNSSNSVIENNQILIHTCVSEEEYLKQFCDIKNLSISSEDLHHVNKYTYFLQEIQYNANILKSFFNNIKTETDIELLLSDDGVLNIRNDLKKPKNNWILFHTTFFNTFLMDKTNSKFPLMNIYFDGVLYKAFYLNTKDRHPVSLPANIFGYHYPRIVRVESSSVEQQIFDNHQSNDIICFCPDFTKTDIFYYHEFEHLQYVPIATSVLKDMSISLKNENHELLYLLPGAATIIKLHFKTIMEKSMNVRLTSAKSALFPENTNNHFKVKLPISLNLDQTWKAALTTINHPSTFTTFLDSEYTRTLIVFVNNTPSKFMFNPKSYSEEEVRISLDLFLKQIGVGFAQFVSDTDKRLKLTITKECKIATFYYTARILGYDQFGKQNLDKKTWNFKFDAVNNKTDVKYDAATREFTLTMRNPINLNYLKPNYMMIYTNFIRSTVMGSKYINIFKIAPLKNTEDVYTISEFKRNDFYHLLYTEIDIIEIQIRSHDGELINFATNHDIILNILFKQDE